MICCSNFFGFGFSTLKAKIIRISTDKILSYLNCSSFPCILAYKHTCSLTRDLCSCRYFGMVGLHIRRYLQDKAHSIFSRTLNVWKASRYNRFKILMSSLFKSSHCSSAGFLFFFVSSFHSGFFKHGSQPLKRSKKATYCTGYICWTVEARDTFPTYDGYCRYSVSSNLYVIFLDKINFILYPIV